MAYISFQPKDYFNTKLYTGNGGNQTITGVGFQPDWVWFKARDAGQSHALVDIVRGTDKVLFSESTAAQGSISSQTFNSDGFALVQDGTANSINSSGSTKVAWSWKANGQGSSNTDGSITSTVSANTTAGFSIVTYTGTGISSGTATVGHGLGEVPSVVIQKRTGGTANWNMYHKSVGNTGSLSLNLTSATNTQTDYWGDTTPTSSVVTIGPNTAISGGNVLYCFAEKKGFSKFGSYVGNGSSDGPFLFCGLKPAFVMIKNISATESWYILDTKRPGYNTNNYYLLPNTSGAEGTSTSLATSLLSNGFKIENSDTSMNTSGQTYIFMAFAEEPLVSSNGVPAVAR